MRLVIVILTLAAMTTPGAMAEATSEMNEGLKRLLDRYPGADLNRDGGLTSEEMRQYRARLWQEETEAGEPIEKDDPATAPSVTVQRFGIPHFSGISYGPLDGQVFELWLPRNAAPPRPTVLYLTLNADDPAPPQVLIESCLDAGMNVGVIHGRTAGDENSYFEDLDTALQYLHERSHAYGILPDAMALFGEAAMAEYLLHAAFQTLHSDAGAGGIRCAALLDPAPRAEVEAPAAPESYLEAAYPKVLERLAETRNRPVIALLHTERHGGDLLHQALRLKNVDTLLHNAAERETLPHLLRMATLFFAETLGKTDTADTPQTEPEKEQP